MRVTTTPTIHTTNTSPANQSHNESGSLKGLKVAAAAPPKEKPATAKPTAAAAKPAVAATHTAPAQAAQASQPRHHRAISFRLHDK